MVAALSEDMVPGIIGAPTGDGTDGGGGTDLGRGQPTTLKMMCCRGNHPKLTEFQVGDFL